MENEHPSDWDPTSGEARSDQRLVYDRLRRSCPVAYSPSIVDSIVTQWRAAGAGPESDLTAFLMHEQVTGRPMGEAELASILRNFTAGEIGTISASVGIMLAFLAGDEPLQARLRSDPALLPYAVDEMLRIQADEFRFGRDQSGNLLYGAGIHACPGAPLARLELRVFMEEFLARTRGFIPGDATPVLAAYPSSGFSSLPLRLDLATRGAPAHV